MSLSAATIAKRLIPIDEALRDAYRAVSAELGADAALSIEVRKLVAEGRRAKNEAKGGGRVADALQRLLRVEVVFGKIAVQADGLSRPSRAQLERAAGFIHDLRADIRTPAIPRRRSA